MFLSPQLVQQLTWLIPVPPLLSFALIVLFTHRSKVVSHTLAIGLMAVSWAMSWLVFFYTLGQTNFGAQVIHAAVDWLPFGSPALKTPASTRLARPATEFCSWMTSGRPSIAAIMPPGND